MWPQATPPASTHPPSLSLSPSSKRGGLGVSRYLNLFALGNQPPDNVYIPHLPRAWGVPLQRWLLTRFIS